MFLVLPFGLCLKEGPDNVTDALLFCIFRYSSELKLVRLKMSEGGVYTFQASNGDASVNHTFTIFVISE